MNEELELTVYDFTGKLVLIETLQDPSNTINIKSLSKGIYLVNINASGKSKSYKIIKE
jgi:hypothetical protein